MTAIANRHGQERDTRLWTADQFLDFYMARPDGERWQLVDGLAMMMTPPNLLHQRIARNFFRLLDAAIVAARPDLAVFYEMGVRIPGIDDFNPTPDLVVIDADATFDRYADRFFLAAEVMSPSNTAEMIDRKVEFYRTHPDNLYCLTIDQDAVRVVLWARGGRWQRRELASLDDVLRLPAFGFEAPLAAIYEGTPLAG